MFFYVFFKKNLLLGITLCFTWSETRACVVKERRNISTISPTKTLIMDTEVTVTFVSIEILLWRYFTQFVFNVYFDTDFCNVNLLYFWIMITYYENNLLKKYYHVLSVITQSVDHIYLKFHLSFFSLWKKKASLNLFLHLVFVFVLMKWQLQIMTCFDDISAELTKEKKKEILLWKKEVSTKTFIKGKKKKWNEHRKKKVKVYLYSKFMFITSLYIPI